MTDDEIRAAFSTHPDHGATVRMVPEADHIAAMRAKDDRIAELERATLIETGHVERLRGERDQLRAEIAASAKP